MRNALPVPGRFRSLRFWKQAAITSISIGVLVVLWSACGGTYTPPLPPPLSSPRVELRGRYGDVLALAFSPTGEWLAAGTSDKMVRLWDVSKSEVLRTMPGHTGEITSLAVSPDGNTLASGSADKTVKLGKHQRGTKFARSPGTPPALPASRLVPMAIRSRRRARMRLSGYGKLLPADNSRFSRDTEAE